MSARGRVRVTFLQGASALVAPDPVVDEVCLHVPDLLADGLGPSRATLAARLEGGVMPQLRRHADAVMAGLGPPARRRLALALSKEDVAAAGVLGARENPEQQLFEGESAWEQVPPLGEADARAVLSALPWPEGKVRVRGLECALLGASEHAPALLTALRRWLPTVLASGCGVHFHVWEGARSSLRAFDPALAPGSSEFDPVGDPAPISNVDVLEGLRDRLGLRRILPPTVWGTDAGAVIVAFPPGKDPAAEVVGVVADGLRALVGVNAIALVPDWALGSLRAPARGALVAAFPRLRFLGLSTPELHALAGGLPTWASVAIRRHLEGAPAGLTREPERTTAGVQVRCARAELPARFAEVLPEIVRHVVRSGAEPDGQPWVRYLARDAASGLELTAEIGVDTTAAVPTQGSVVGGHRAAGIVAAAQCQGPYAGLAAEHERLRADVLTAGLHPAGDAAEIYHTDTSREADPGRWRATVRLPVV